MRYLLHYLLPRVFIPLRWEVLRGSVSVSQVGKVFPFLDVKVSGTFERGLFRPNFEKDRRPGDDPTCMILLFRDRIHTILDIKISQDSKQALRDGITTTAKGFVRQIVLEPSRAQP